MKASADDSITILLVDDHALFREGIREILELQDGLEVVGEAGDSDGAVALTAEQRPDVVLLDVEIPGDDAVTTTLRIRRCSPKSQVIILSMYEGQNLVQNLLAAGIRGYLLKSVHRNELVSAVRSTRDGNGPLTLAVSPESVADTRGSSTAATLTGREREILELVAEALSNAQIGCRVGLTEATVKRHLRNVYAKLGAVSRVDAVNKAQAASLVTVPGRTASRRQSPPSPPSHRALRRTARRR